MPRQTGLPRRSAKEWIVRALLAVLAAITCYVEVTRTIAYTLRKGNIEIAHALSPGDGRITGLLAQTLIENNTTFAGQGRVKQLARSALRQDPTVVAAVFSLGLIAQVRGDTKHSRRLFTYAETLSRRDVKTQLWAIEDAVGRGEVDDALLHYDIALRTSSTAADLLFPVLAAAIYDPAIRKSLTRTLVKKPAWRDAFIIYAAVKGPDARATSRLLIDLRHAGVPISGVASGEIMNLLIFGGFVDDAWAYYSTVHPGADRRRSRDPRFADGGVSTSPFDWIPINDAGISSSIQRGENGGIFDFSVPASVGGPMLQQRQILPPGEYRLDGHASGIDQSEEAQPYWVLACSSDHELGRIALSNSTQSHGKFMGSFRVPAGCPVQTLTLVARPSYKVSGISGQIDRVQLYPVR